VHLARPITVCFVMFGMLLPARIPHGKADARDCTVMRLALSTNGQVVSPGASLDGVQVSARTVAPWQTWQFIDSTRRRQLVTRVRAELGDALAPVEALTADTARLITGCASVLKGVRFLPVLPSPPSDTSVASLSAVAWSDDGQTALIYIGWSNQWVGRGTFYQFRESGGVWRVVASASAWVQ